MINKNIDFRDFDYLIKDKYILTKPVPAEELTGEEYEETYMINQILPSLNSK